jgi:hypothetical protein
MPAEYRTAHEKQPDGHQEKPEMPRMRRWVIHRWIGRLLRVAINGFSRAAVGHVFDRTPSAPWDIGDCSRDGTVGPERRRTFFLRRVAVAALLE